MNKINNLDDYLEAERRADELYENPSQQDELLRLIELMINYETQHPEQISKIYGDDTYLQDPDSTFEEEISTWTEGFDY